MPFGTNNVLLASMLAELQSQGGDFGDLSYLSSIDSYVGSTESYASSIYDDVSWIYGEVSNYMYYLSDIDSYASSIDGYVSSMYSDLSDTASYTYTMSQWDDSGRCRSVLDGKSSASNGSVSVGSTSTSVLSSNSSRLAATFSNDSAEVIYLALGSSATSGSGIRVGIGETFHIDQTNRYTGAVNAICASGGKNLCYTEL